MSYVILTSKDGIFRTEGDAHLRPVETWDYLFYGRRRARFVVVEVLAETKVRIVDDQEPANVNLVPSRLLAHFDSIDAVRRELASLTTYGTMDTSLQHVA